VCIGQALDYRGELNELDALTEEKTIDLERLFSRITGLYYLSAVVLILFAFLLLIVFHFSVVISKLTDRNKELTQRHSLLELEFNEFKKRLCSESRRNPS
jgi:hypothetical protein